MPKRKKTRRATGTGSIYQEANGRWRAKFVEGEHRKEFSGWVYEQVEAELDAHIEEFRNPRLSEYATRSSSPVRDWFREWLTDIAPERVKTYTLWTYESRLKRLANHIGDIPLRDLTSSDIRLAYRRLQSKDGLKPETVAAYHVTLQSCLKDAVESDLIERSPCAAVRRPRFERREMNVFSFEQAQRFLKGTVDDPMYSLFALLITTGLRKGEALALHWKEVDLGQMTLYVKYTLHDKQGGGKEFTDPKSKRSRRTVQLSPEAVVVLQSHQAAQRKQVLRSKDGLVFPSDSGQPQHGARVCDALKAECERLALPALRPHELRHTYATLALHHYRLPIDLVSKNLGHASTSTTYDLYSHVLPEYESEAARKMGGLLR